MQIGDSISIDGNVTASGKLGGGTQASQAGDAVLLGSDSLIPASLLPSMDSGWTQPYFFINASKIPTFDVNTNINAITKYSNTALVYTNTTMLFRTNYNSSSITIIDPATVNGIPIFSRYLCNSSSSKVTEGTLKTTRIQGADLVSLLSPAISSNITGSISLKLTDFYGIAGDGNITLEDGMITGGAMNFGSDNGEFSPYKWWIS